MPTRIARRHKPARTAATRRPAIRKRNARTITYRSDVDGVVRVLEVDDVREAPGGIVKGLRGDSWWPYQRRRVIAIDGEPIDHGGRASDRLAKTIPVPRSTDTARLLRDFFDACRGSRTLRTAVERVRADHPRGGGVVNERGSALDVASTDASRDAEVQVQRPGAEFVGGSPWDQKTRKAVRAKLFDALVAWGVLTDPWGMRGDRTAQVGWDLMRLESYDDVFAGLVRRILDETGSSRRAFFAPEWGWYGLDELAVHHAMVRAETYGHFKYMSAGTVINISFPDR